ncbi:MAG TPA: hypothetical protein VM261_38165 [Kofleriaceae bacterium]|nr:hypothetical protein [Kofleriaceae bacterium]
MRAKGKLVWWAFALTLVAGCNQIFGLDLPAREEPTDARDHDAVDLDAAADRDGDGVLDDDDLCPDVADPGQFDEDGDARGDRCDLCPHLAQLDDTDGDEDNIPDACDPYERIAGGRLRWSGFHGAEELGDWRALGSGTATWTDDAIELAPVLDGEARFVRVEPADPAMTRTRVIASVEIGAPNAGSVARRTVGLVTNVEPQVGNNLFLCQLETDVPQPDVRLAEYRIESPVAATILASSIGTQFPLGEVTLEFDIGADDDTDMTQGAFCQVNGVTGARTLPRTTVVDLPPGLAGVRTVGVPLRVRWAVVIDHPSLETTD